MYGMIHRAIRQMVFEEGGAEAWAAIERERGIGPAELISAAIYPDELTAELVSLAAERLALTVPECLRLLGRCWVRLAASGPYRGIMDFAGRDLASFIANLDRMHVAVVSAMPQARAPQFALVDASDDMLEVSYRSTRQGLEPFVHGLLEGLLDHFGHNGTVKPGLPCDDGIRFLVMLGNDLPR